MSNNITLKTLFAVLHGSLPYEYDEKYVNGVGLEDSIVISKTSSDHVICINANTPDDNGVFDVTLYDDINDDDHVGITIWDTNSPNLDLIDLIAYIEESL